MKGQNKSEYFDDIIHSYMNDQINRMGFSDLSKADTKSKGLAFLRFYLYEIFSQFIDIDEEELESGIVDKANDLGIDFIHISDDKVYIFQSKYGKAYIGKETLEHFIQIPELIYNKEYINKGHDELRNILKEIGKIKDPYFQINLITNQKIQPDQINFYEGRESEKNVVYNILSFTQLRQEYSRIESLNYLPPQEVVFDMGSEDYVELEKLPDEYPTVLVTQKGSKIHQIYHTYRESLFNYNIRFWLGKNAINSGMIDTIQSEPERFFYYNNGVTAVCEKYELKNENKQSKLICKNLQIINGAQTVTTIAKQDPSKLSRVKVLFKIVCGETGPKTKSEHGLNENIVKFSNSQTMINPETCVKTMMLTM